MFKGLQTSKLTKWFCEFIHNVYTHSIINTRELHMIHHINTADTNNTSQQLPQGTSHKGPRMSFTSKRSQHQPKGRASLIFVLVAVLQVSISHLVWWDPCHPGGFLLAALDSFGEIFQGKLQMPRQVATTYLLHAKSRHVWSFHHHVLYLPLDHVTKGHHCCS